MATITIGQLVTDQDIKSLTTYIERMRGQASTHNLIMRWLDKQPHVMENFRKHQVIKAYGAYLLEYALKL